MAGRLLGALLGIFQIRWDGTRWVQDGEIIPDYAIGMIVLVLGIGGLMLLAVAAAFLVAWIRY